MAFDPCDLVPDNTIPAGAPLQPQHAVHHVVGRIRHREAQLAHARDAPNFGGCERHGRTAAPLQRRAPSAPALAAVSGAGGAAIGGLGVFAAGRVSKSHKHSVHGQDGPTPVPEPSSAVMLGSMLLICVVLGRVFRRRVGRGVAITF